MPKRKITAARALQIKQWQIAGVRARKRRGVPIGKLGLPHIKVIQEPRYEGVSFLKIRSLEGKRVVGELQGTIDDRQVSIFSVGRKINGAIIYDSHRRRPSSATLEPGISLLTGAARIAESNKVPMKVLGAIKEADAFYQLTGGQKRIKSGINYRYGKKAIKRLASRRVVMVR